VFLYLSLLLLLLLLSKKVRYEHDA